MAPSKYITVIFKKSYKRLANRWAGEGTNSGHSIRLGVVKKYLFRLFNELCHCPMFFYIHGLEVVIHLHHSYVAISYGHLISTEISYSIIGREFDHQVVSGGYNLS